jgi:hypothetical protein
VSPQQEAEGHRRAPRDDPKGAAQGWAA